MATQAPHAHLIGLHQNTHPAKCGETQRRESEMLRGIKSQRQPLEGDRRLNRQVAYTCDSGPFLAAYLPSAEAPIL